MTLKYNPYIHRRRSIRLQDYDYAQNGFYFVTICVQNNIPLFGGIESSHMNLNDAGKMVYKAWITLPNFFDNVHLHEFIIMPDHMHGIIEISEKGTHRLGNIIHRYKSYTTCEYTKQVQAGLWQPFESRLWQRNYYEHIIRNDSKFYAICEYIQQNPAKHKKSRT